MTATEVGGQGRTAYMTAKVTGAVTCPNVTILYFVAVMRGH
jgi:hypothetical protein